MAKDPVCGMDVDPSQAAGQSVYKGQTYYFCSKGCKVAFDRNPEKYVNASDAHEGHGRHD
jgi:Cu+-exporting ATPase